MTLALLELQARTVVSVLTGYQSSLCMDEEVALF